MEFVNKATGVSLYIPKTKVNMNVCGIWPIAQISNDFYYLGIWQCARYFVAALFKELALITIKEMWGLESRSRTSRSRPRLLWQSLGLGGFGLQGCTQGGGVGLKTPLNLLCYKNVITYAKEFVYVFVHFLLVWCQLIAKTTQWFCMKVSRNTVNGPKRNNYI